MPSLIELDTSGSTDIDAANKAAAVRIFHTDLPTPVASREAFYSEVGRGQHPDNPALRFDRLSIVPEDRGSGHRLTAYYSTFGGGRFNTVARPEEYTYRWDYGNVSVETTILPSIRVKRIVKGANNAEESVDVWEQTEVIVRERRTAWTLSCYALVENVRAFEIITDQLDNIHTINGKRARFANASITLDESRKAEGSSPTSASWYRIEYTWEVDKGTRKPIDWNLPGQLQPATNYVITAPLNMRGNRFDGIIREPYTTLTSLPSEDPKTTPHETLQVNTYTEDEDGWRSLPGTEGIQ
jgi:hypothetical protein